MLALSKYHALATPLIAGHQPNRGTTGHSYLIVLMLCASFFPALPVASAQSSKSTEIALQTVVRDKPDHSTLASISGSVADNDGATIAGAQIMLTLDGSHESKKTVSGTDGTFRFSNLSPEAFRLSATHDGFTPREIQGSLHAGEQSTLPPILLNAAANMEIQVVLSQHDEAQAEMKAQEKQRLAGVIPNFFVTYNWNAAPLSSRQKFELSWKETFDPGTFAVVAGTAGLEQAQNDFSGYGRGAQGYGKRFGAGLADTTIGNFMGGAVLPSLLHQDPRYFYKGTGSFRSRLAYAIAAAAICKGDNGRWQPNYSSLLGDLSAGAISNVYYPASDRHGAALTFENGLLGIGEDAIGNIIQEFLFRKITSHVAQNRAAKP